MSNKARTIKSCDLPAGVAAELFRMLNGSRITFNGSGADIVIVTDVEPKDLVYPEGWYYAKGTFRNKHQSTTSYYDMIYLVKTDGTLWRDVATYCTLYDN